MTITTCLSHIDMTQLCHLIASDEVRTNPNAYRSTEVPALSAYLYAHQLDWAYEDDDEEGLAIVLDRYRHTRLT